MSIDFLTFKKNRIICFEDNEIEAIQLLQQALRDIIENNSLLSGRGISVSVEYEPCELSDDGYTTYQTFSLIFSVNGEEIGNIVYATDGEKPDVTYRDGELVFLYVYMELSRTCTDIATLQYASPTELTISLENEVIQSLEQYF